jgi:putative membrane protein
MPRIAGHLRDHVPAATAILSAVSIGLVFAAALQALPTALLPRSTPLIAAIPHVNAALSAAAIPVIASGWLWARRGAVRRHRAAMATGVALFAAFLGLYLYRVALVGPASFDGTGIVRTAYSAILGVHIVLAVACIPLLYYVLLLALTRPVEALRRSRHPTVGRIAAPLWIVSFALGLVVYGLLHW